MCRLNTQQRKKVANLLTQTLHRKTRRFNKVSELES